MGTKWKEYMVKRLIQEWMSLIIIHKFKLLDLYDNQIGYNDDD
jgi:hypothetical protein